MSNREKLQEAIGWRFRIVKKTAYRERITEGNREKESQKDIKGSDWQEFSKRWKKKNQERITEQAKGSDWLRGSKGREKENQERKTE